MDRISRHIHGVEGVWFGALWITSLLFADDVVLLASSVCDYQLSLTSTALKLPLRVSTSHLSLQAAALLLRERSLIHWEVFVYKMLLPWEGRTLEERHSEETTTRGAQVLSRRLIKESEGEASPAINNGNVAFPFFYLTCLCLLKYKHAFFEGQNYLPEASLVFIFPFDSSLLGLGCTETGRTWALVLLCVLHLSISSKRHSHSIWCLLLTSLREWVWL